MYTALDQKIQQIFTASSNNNVQLHGLNYTLLNMYLFLSALLDFSTWIKCTFSDIKYCM